MHLAAAGVSPKQARWSELVQVNVVGSLQLLEMAKEIGVRRFVVAEQVMNMATLHVGMKPYPDSLEPVNAYGYQGSWISTLKNLRQRSSA